MTARLPEGAGFRDIGIAGGRIRRIAPRLTETAASEIAAGGRLVIPGLVESHSHLDKALLGTGARHSTGTFQSVIRAPAEAKRAFTVEDIAARARRALEMAIRHATTAMRTHVEVDPTLGLKAMEAIVPLRDAYAWPIDLKMKICVFPQEGLFTASETEALMREALAMGADVVGGVPYFDTDARAHVELVFALAREFNRDVDFHLDTCDEARDLSIGHVAALTVKQGWQGPCPRRPHDRARRPRAGRPAAHRGHDPRRRHLRPRAAGDGSLPDGSGRHAERAAGPSPRCVASPRPA